MILAFLAGVAFAAGGGPYVGFSNGAATTDAAGFIGRGHAAQFDVGVYWGNYRSTFRYGQYWRVGFTSKVFWLAPLGSMVESDLDLGVSVGRGVDLMSVGGWFSISAGYTVTSSAPALGTDMFQGQSVDAKGMFARAAVGVSYNFAPVVAVNARVEPGFHYTTNGLSFLGGVGLGIQFRLPMIRSKDWEGERRSKRHKRGEPPPPEQQEE